MDGGASRAAKLGGDRLAEPAEVGGEGVEIIIGIILDTHERPLCPAHRSGPLWLWLPRLCDQK